MMCSVFCTADHPLLGTLYEFENDTALEKKKRAMVDAQNEYDRLCGRGKNPVYPPLDPSNNRVVE